MDDKQISNIKKTLKNRINDNDYFSTLKILGHYAYHDLPNDNRVEDTLEELVEKYEFKHIKNYLEINKIISYIATHCYPYTSKKL